GEIQPALAHRLRARKGCGVRRASRHRGQVALTHDGAKCDRGRNNKECVSVRGGRKSMAKSKVAVLKCKPETILGDIERLGSLAGLKQALVQGKTTILKDNISWHYPFPAANTTPWQMEGTILALRAEGLG